MGFKKNIAYMGLVKQLDMMFKIDILFSSTPNKRYTLGQVSTMLGVSTRTVERIYKVMKKFGAPINTRSNPPCHIQGGTCYKLDKNKKYNLNLSPELMDRIMSTYRIHCEYIKAARSRRKSQLIKNLLTFDK